MKKQIEYSFESWRKGKGWQVQWRSIKGDLIRMRCKTLAEVKELEAAVLEDFSTDNKKLKTVEVDYLPVCTYPVKSISTVDTKNKKHLYDLEYTDADAFKRVSSYFSKQDAAMAFYELTVDALEVLLDEPYRPEKFEEVGVVANRNRYVTIFKDLRTGALYATGIERK